MVHYIDRSLFQIFDILTLKNGNMLEVIEKCKSCFSLYRISETIRTDSGTQFQTTKSSEFQNFCEKYGFKLIRNSPHFNQSNEVAEAAVKLAKSIIEEQRGPIHGITDLQKHLNS